jgi:hypothetical protein
MRRKTLITLAVVVVAAFVVWRLVGQSTAVSSVLNLVGPATVTPVPRTPQPQNGAQALQQSPAPSNLATLFPPAVFGSGFGDLDS